MKKLTIFSAAMMAVGALWAATPSVTILKAQQRYPWADKIDIDWSLTCDTLRHYGLKFMLIEGGLTNVVNTDVMITPADNIESKSGRYTIDVPTQAPDFDEKLNVSGIKIVAVLSDQGFLDVGDGVTFIPQDYLVLNLQTGEVDPLVNVTDPANYNIDAYKTTSMIFRRVPAGKFRMGATDAENGAYTTGTEVTMSNDYYIACFPCTQKQWKMVAGSVPNNQRPAGDTYPCMQVSWNMIAGSTSPQFVTNLNARMSASVSGSAYQVSLPTGAQWERAARAGTTTKWFYGTTAETTGTYGNYSTSAMTLAGAKSPNGWGLYDVYGNLWEWTLDRSADRCVYRGGCYQDAVSDASSVSSLNEVPSTSDYSTHHSGFRLVMTPR